jgi:hypothetical protein
VRYSGRSFLIRSLYRMKRFLIQGCLLAMGSVSEMGAT